LSPDQGATWVEKEFGGADLGDPRRTKRLVKISAKFAANPGASMPMACETPDRLKAAYRFFDNDHVNELAMLEPHQQANKTRMAGQAVVLAVQDTTQLDFTHHPATTGLGMLTDTAHQGLFYHPTLLVTPEKVPLGLADHLVWERPEAECGKKHQRKQRPISDKESRKWLHSLEKTAQLQAEMPQVHLVNIADREGDIYDYFVTAQRLQIDVLVRAAWDRRLAEADGDHLWEHLAAAAVAGELDIQVPRRKGKPARRAVLSVRYRRVSLQPPRSRYQEKDLEPVTVWAVYAHEEHPPPGQEAVSWMLLTTVPVATFDEATEKIHWYTCRWQIELFFKILKSGCKIEHVQLETATRLRRCLAVYAVVAWRVMFLTMQARAVPDLPSDVLLELEEWQALYCHHHQTKTPPPQPPTLAEAVRMIARLGGFIGRKSDGHPGPTVIWRGLQRLQDLAATWRLWRGA
jgi:hypothetical protein